MILQGEGNRQWFEALYVDPKLDRLGRVRTVIPAAPDEPDGLLDATIAFVPVNYEECAGFAAVRDALGSAEVLDFGESADGVLAAWAELREQARPIFAGLNIWLADLVPINGTCRRPAAGLALRAQARDRLRQRNHQDRRACDGSPVTSAATDPAFRRRAGVHRGALRRGHAQGDDGLTATYKFALL
jgi:hypothetical protein